MSLGQSIEYSWQYIAPKSLAVLRGTKRNPNTKQLNVCVESSCENHTCCSRKRQTCCALSHGNVPVCSLLLASASQVYVPQSSLANRLTEAYGDVRERIGRIGENCLDGSFVCLGLNEWGITTEEEGEESKVKLVHGLPKLALVMNKWIKVLVFSRWRRFLIVFLRLLSSDGVLNCKVRDSSILHIWVSKSWNGQTVRWIISRITQIK